jgi:hypothetical protein
MAGFFPCAEAHDAARMANEPPRKFLREMLAFM